MCAGVSSHMDDEYKWAGVEDPKVMVTTSRDPSSRLKMFVKVCPHYVSRYWPFLNLSFLDSLHPLYSPPSKKALEKIGGKEIGLRNRRKII